jgi:hypothetical protein
MEAEGFGRISMAEASRRLKRAATTFIAHLKKITDFSAELEKISAVDEYQSLDALLGQEDGTGSDSASPSPS